jgi:predicted nucleic acid-binding Zn ribbon protein
LVDNYGLRERLDEEHLRAAWAEVVGEMVARHTLGIELRHGRLRVRVDSAPLRHELGYMREELVGRLNERLGRTAVKEVVLG